MTRQLALRGLVAGILSGPILAGSRSTDLQAGGQLRLPGLSILTLCITVAGILRQPALNKMPGLAGEVQRMAEMEKRVLSIYVSATEKLGAGRMLNEDFVRLLQSEILP